MLKGRLNNLMRADMQQALLLHAYAKSKAELNAEGIDLRNAALEGILTKKQLAAIETLVPLLRDSARKNEDRINWGDRVVVNCGGPKIYVGLTFSEDYYESSRPIEGSYPILRAFGDLRLDLPADDDLAKRVQNWADRCEALKTEYKVSSEQIRAALAAFSTVSQFQSSWPDAVPVVQDILIEHLGRPAPGLPAVVIEQMNAKLGLPPASNDETAEAVAA